jgi:alkylation response protein AidB-like acyl-CoA dehydrogenase
MNSDPGLDLVERAKALAPLIEREADEIERTRRLTPAVTQALIENGLYRALLPQSLGGAEAPLETFMQMQEESPSPTPRPRGASASAASAR